MTHWILAGALGCIVACSARGQALTGASVDASGMKLYLYFDSYGPSQTNGTVNLGWATNNQPFVAGAPKVRMTSAKPGFRLDGGSVLPVHHFQLTFGGSRMRFPYPQHASLDCQATPGGIRVGVSVTDHVFSEDTNLVVEVDSALYHHGGTNSLAGSSVVTNESALVYGMAPAVANWSRTPPWTRMTNDTHRVYSVGGGGQRPWPPRPETLFRPLAAMGFVARDLYGNATTSVVSNMSIDPAIQRRIPTGRYQADLLMTGMSNRSPVRLDFIAWPHLGTSNSVLDTRLDRYTGATGLPTAITNLWDPAQEYSQAVAIVDPSGSDSTGTTTSVDAVPGHTNFFASIAKAAHALRTNHAASATWAHDDAGGGVILIRNGVTNWLGGSQSYGTNPLARVIIDRYPGHDPELTTVSGNQDISDRIEIRNLRVGGSGNLFSGIDYLAMRSCVISNTGTALWANVPVLHLVDCQIPRVSGGLRPFSTQNTRFHLDGCDLDGFSGSLNPAFMVGTWHSYRAGGDPFILMQDTSPGQTASTDWFIWFNNEIPGLQQTSLAWWVGQNQPIQNGGWIAQNIFAITTNHVAAVFNWGGSVYSHTNVFAWHNVMTGKRAAGFWYNDTGTNFVGRTLIGWMNNLVENFGYKTDDFGTGDGARTGNWGVMWSVGHRGNVHVNANTTGVEAPASFIPEFAGLQSYHPGSAFTNRVDWPAMIDPRSVGYPSVEGVGDYRFRSSSPIYQQFQLPLDIPLPFDLEGLPRGLWDPPGPYRSGNPRRSVLH